MRTRHLLSLLSFLFLYQWTGAQQMKPADPALRQRLMKYSGDNHLYPGGTYMYWDSVTKKPVRFSAKDFLVEDHSAQLPNPATHAINRKSNGTVNRLGGVSNFHLVKDVNTFTDAYPRNNNSDFTPTPAFAVLNNVCYFSANDGIHGSELWRSDGTAAGTYLVKDIAPGTDYSSPDNITTVGSSLFFLTYKYYDSYEGAVLWKSDGTANGTVQLKDFSDTSALNYSRGPANLCDVNDTLYFTLTGTNKNYNGQLWKSDGTSTGTVEVKDFSPAGGSNLRNLVSLNGLLYFTGSDAATGAEVWRSDGTNAGTYMIKDVNPSNTYNSFNAPAYLTPYNGKLYFAESDTTNSYILPKLWVTDGTANGTTVVPGYNNIILDNVDSRDNQSFVISSNALYFQAYTYATGTELYKYDFADTAAGIVLVNDFTPGTGSTNVYAGYVIDVNGTVYLSYTDNAGVHLYKTNGADSTTSELVNLPSGSSIYNLTNGNGKLYFTAYTVANGAEPWVSDGTDTGTALLQDVYSGTVSSYPNYFTAFRGGVLFAATGSGQGNELWLSKGSGAQLVTEINTTTTTGSYATQIAPFAGGKVLMNAYTYDIGSELWTSDGTDESLVKDIYPGQNYSYPAGFVTKNNVTYFGANSPSSYSNSVCVFKTDGTEAGTVNLTPNLNGSLIDFAVTDNGDVFYFFNNYTNGQYELWKTDGTPTGNVLVRSGFSFIYSYFFFYAYGFGDQERLLTPVGNLVYFPATVNGSSTGTELWKSDGTTAGTMQVKDIYPGTGNSDPVHITAFNNEVYFNATSDVDVALWKSNGTAAGTVRVSGVQPVSFMAVNNILFLAGFTDSTSTELWKTDGTTAGTVQVKDIYSGRGSSNPYNLTNVSGTLFFGATDAAHGAELWKSDGTASGTQLVQDITPGAGGSTLSNFTVAANKLFFANGTNSRVIWGSDGTSAGTGQVIDEGLNGVMSAYNLSGIGNKLFFTGYSYQYGEELYVGDASLAVLPVTLTSFTASLKGADVLSQWQTASEMNTSYFNVQRSADGVHFSDAGKVMAKGISSTYSFTDANIANLVSAKTIYYRLQIVDKDGSSSLSKVVPINLNLKSAIVLLLPNPVKDLLTIRINNYTGKASFAVFDANGKNVYSTQKMIQSGGDVLVNASSLQSGVYLVKINLDDKTIQQKFVKE